ncbi:MAG: hypothetical protein CL473_07735 [Acidobacteria bacterium]|nr:hypothetical protein [Acidobacteriota bacterium]
MIESAKTDRRGPNWTVAGAAANLPAANVSDVSPPTLRDRLVALGEITLCSGFPTQVALIPVLAIVGVPPPVAVERLTLSYVVTLSLADTVLLLSLIWVLLRAHGERPAELLLGQRPVAREAILGLLWVPGMLLLATTAFVIMMRFAPALHNVLENPLETLIDSPGAAVAFAFVVVVAGGIREEVQRAFILRRFEHHLGGMVVGVVVFSAVFALGHLVQGRDAAIVTGLLGAFWGIWYLRRGSVIGPVVCHAGFNLVEVLLAVSASGG